MTDIIEQAKDRTYRIDRNLHNYHEVTHDLINTNTLHLDDSVHSFNIELSAEDSVEVNRSISLFYDHLKEFIERTKDEFIIESCKELYTDKKISKFDLLCKIVMFSNNNFMIADQKWGIISYNDDSPRGYLLDLYLKRIYNYNTNQSLFEAFFLPYIFVKPTHADVLPIVSREFIALLRNCYKGLIPARTSYKSEVAIRIYEDVAVSDKYKEMNWYHRDSVLSNTLGILNTNSYDILNAPEFTIVELDDDTFFVVLNNEKVKYIEHLDTRFSIYMHNTYETLRLGIFITNNKQHLRKALNVCHFSNVKYFVPDLEPHSFKFQYNHCIALTENMISVSNEHSGWDFSNERSMKHYIDHSGVYKYEHNDKIQNSDVAKTENGIWLLYDDYVRYIYDDKSKISIHGESRFKANKIEGNQYYAIAYHDNHARMFRFIRKDNDKLIFELYKLNFLLNGDWIYQIEYDRRGFFVLCTSFSKIYIISIVKSNMNLHFSLLKFNNEVNLNLIFIKNINNRVILFERNIDKQSELIVFPVYRINISNNTNIDQNFDQYECFKRFMGFFNSACNIFIIDDKNGNIETDDKLLNSYIEKNSQYYKSLKIKDQFKAMVFDIKDMEIHSDSIDEKNVIFDISYAGIKFKISNSLIIRFNQLKINHKKALKYGVCILSNSPFYIIHRN